MSDTDAYQRWMDGFSTDSLDAGFAEETIDHLELHDPVGVSPDTTVRDCIDTMRRAGIGCLVVGTDKVVEGIFTERDVLNKIAGQDVNTDTAQVREFMTTNPNCLEEGDRVVQALSLMIDGGYRHVPIVRNGKVIGVFGMRHCMQIIVNLFPDAILNAPPPQQGYNQNREGA
jgi:CBS domain-containing protein